LGSGGVIVQKNRRGEKFHKGEKASKLSVL